MCSLLNHPNNVINPFYTEEKAKAEGCPVPKFRFSIALPYICKKWTRIIYGDRL